MKPNWVCQLKKYYNLKIGVIIPTRNNRKELLENCLRMINNQTVKPFHVELINDTPVSEKCDITWRYKLGYERLKGKGFDIIFLMEDDDYYSPTYIETMLAAWIKNGKPDLIGTDYTIYYHIGLFAWFTFYHSSRSSAMSTAIKPDLDFKWCADHEPYTDMHLWKTLRGVVFKPEKHICLGIKHGTTMTGGRSHVDRLNRYLNTDEEKAFLQANTDLESFNFYSYFIKK